MGQLPGSRPPTPEQLARLQALSAHTGQRYARPRSYQQAASRIRDLEVRARARVRHRVSVRRDRAPQGDFLALIQRLRRAHYAYADALARGKHGRDELDRARALERRIDELLGAPLDA